MSKVYSLPSKPNRQTTVDEKPEISVLSLQTGTGVDGLAGTELMAFNILSRLDPSKFRITVCLLQSEGPLSQMYREKGIEVYHLNGGSLLNSVWRLWRILSSRRFNIIEIYGLRANIIGRVIGRLTGHRTIVTLQRSVDDWRRAWHVLLDRLTCRWVTLYVSNTQTAAHRLQEREKIPSSKIRVIENGVNVSTFNRAQKGLVRAELGIESSRPILTCVANFKRVKGHINLIDTVAVVHSQNPNVCLWLVGDGPLRPEIERKVRQLELESVIKVLGQRSDISEILADTDVFIMASLWEGMPNAILEAMAAKLPIVATRVGGIPEVVVDGETGFLVPPENPAAFAEKVTCLIEDRKLRQKMGEASYRRIQSAFTVDMKVREFQDLYKRLSSNSM